MRNNFYPPYTIRHRKGCIREVDTYEPIFIYGKKYLKKDRDKHLLLNYQEFIEHLNKNK